MRSRRLAKARPDIATAAAPLAEPAKSGVASRAVLIERFARCAARSPWRSGAGRSRLAMRALGAAARARHDPPRRWRGQSAAEAGSSAAERALAAGDCRARDGA